MFILELSYDDYCEIDETDERIIDLRSGLSIADMVEKYDGYYAEISIVNLAIHHGWDIDAAMADEYIQELINNALEWDGETTVSIRRLLVNKAYNYLLNYDYIPTPKELCLAFD